jgi:hypothetical protein
MKASSIFTSLLCLLCSIGTSQEFQTTIIAENINGSDTVIIGYDSSASIEIDGQFGEIDINNTRFDATFEIRVGQIDLNHLDCKMNDTSVDSTLITYMSKVDIVPRDCQGWDKDVTINGFVPITSMFIRSKDLPVTLRWQSAVFNNVCLEASLFTDWHPGGWFDAECGNLSIDPFELATRDSVLITNPSGVSILDSFGDTLSLFHIALGGEDFLGDVSDASSFPIAVYPNPTRGVVRIGLENLSEATVEVYDIHGDLLSTSTDNQIDLSEYPDGIYIIRISSKGNYFTDRVIKYGQ